MGTCEWAPVFGAEAVEVLCCVAVASLDPRRPFWRLQAAWSISRSERMMLVKGDGEECAMQR